MKIIKKYFNDSVILFKTTKFNDKRGFFSEMYNRETMSKLSIQENFNQDNFSFSNKKGIIRGLHFQNPPFQQSKIIRVIKGKILDVFLDIRKKSNTYGLYKKVILSRDNFKQLYLPAGFAHGFQSLEDNTEVHYKVSNKYSKKHEVSINFDDNYLSIKWNYSLNLKLSEKDKNGLSFKDFKSLF